MRTVVLFVAAVVIAGSVEVEGGERPEHVRALDAFVRLVGEGKIEEALASIRHARDGSRGAVARQQLEAAHQVADRLMERERSVERGARKLIGQPVTLQTTRGERSGTVRDVTEDGIVIVHQIKIRGRVMGETVLTVTWTQLEDRQRKRLATTAGESKPTPGTTAILALAKRDFAAARAAVAAAPKHPLAGYVVSCIARHQQAQRAARSEEAEAAAKAAWTRLAKFGQRTSISGREGRALAAKIEAYTRSHAGTQFFESITDELTNLRRAARAAEAYAVNLATTKGAMVAYCIEDNRRGESRPQAVTITNAGVGIGGSEAVVSRDGYDALSDDGEPLAMRFTIAPSAGKKIGDPADFKIVAYYPELIDDDPDTNATIGRFWWLKKNGTWQNGFTNERGGGYGDGRSISGGPIRVGDTVEVIIGIPAEKRPLHGLTIRVNGRESRLFSNSGWHPRIVHMGFMWSRTYHMSEVRLNRPPVSRRARLGRHLVMQHGGHRYQLVQTSLTWEDARKACEARGGHLATVTSEAERDVVSELVLRTGKPAWLGGTDAETEGTWRWITGEPWTISHWHDGQPSNGHNDEHCVSADWGIEAKWNDRSGNTTNHYVCEWDAPKRTGLATRRQRAR